MQLALNGWLNKLEESRARIRAQLIVAGVWRSLTLGLLVLAGSELLRVVLVVAGASLEFGLEHSLLVGTAVLLLSLAWNSYRAWAATPGLAEVALLADHRFALQERLTTALEALAQERRTLAQEALLADAQRYAHELAPDELVPRTRPRLWPALALLALFAMVQLLPLPLAPTASGSGPGQSPILATEDESGAETGAKVRRVAELVGRDAEARRDPYLQAVARSFEELGERIERGELDRAEIDREVGRLLQHLDQALGGEESLASGLLSTSQETSADPQGQDPSGAPGGSPTPESGDPMAGPLDEGDVEGNEDSSSEEGGSDSMPPGLDEILTQLEARLQPQSESDGNSPTASTDGRDRNPSGFYANIDPELIAEIQERNDQLALQRAQRQAGGQPVGAAEESNEGAGDFAGEGGQPLEAGAEEGLELGDAGLETESVALANERQGDGRRIEIDVPPQTDFTDVEPSAPAAAGGEWQRGHGAASNGRLLGMMHREAISRYFLPLMEEDREQDASTGSD